MDPWLLFLPPALLDDIIVCLDVRDTLRVSCASKYLHALCQQDSIWLRKWLYQQQKLLYFRGSWKATVLHSSAAPPTSIEHTAVCKTLLPSLHHQRLLYRCNLQPDKSPRVSTGPPVETCSRGQPGVSAVPQVWRGLMDSWSTDRWTDPKSMEPVLATAFKVAKPDGGSCLMTLLDYLRYTGTQRDEDPLYIFDGDFGARFPRLLQEYSTPSNCPEDLFSVLGDDRPDFQWLVIGPVRSGSYWHQDPSGTCAWNALVAGKKRWFFYPPNVLPPGMCHNDDRSFTPVQWLLEVLPEIPPHQKPFEHLQLPGEVVFLPSRWWHFAINVEDTIAVTENFVPLHGLEAAVRDLAWGHADHSFLGVQPESAELSCDRRDAKPAMHATSSTPDQAVPCHGDALSSLRAQVEAAHSADAEESVTGFLRSRHLGAWLKTLIKQKPELTRDVVNLGEKYAHLSLWASAVSEICEASGLPKPSLQDCFPVSGGPTVVFLTPHHTVLKFFTRGTLEAALDAYAELASLQSIAVGSTPDGMFPQLLASSHQHPSELVPCLVEAGRDDDSPGQLPWVLTSSCAGRSIRRIGPIPTSIAAAAGAALAELHSLPPPGEKNTVNLPPRGSAQKPEGRPGLGSWFFKDDVAWEASAAAHEVPWGGADPWQPFLDFLAARRKDVHATTFRHAGLSLHLLGQLDDYLPEDAGNLVRAPSDASLPRLLHGDLSPGNILVDEEDVRLIDFGDAGHGDPLFDLIPLHLITFRMDERLTESFLRGYRGRCAEEIVWLRARGPFLPSYCAMCYSLLHPQDILSSVFETAPQLWEAQDLQTLQSQLWGFLDTLEY